MILGEAGRQPGQFSKPRALAVSDSGDLVVIDRTGRIQIFNEKTLEFKRQWRLPDYDNGTPTGITMDNVDPGTFWVADTHYSRILKYTLEGELIFQFGENGEDPGKMVFPTDVAPDPDGQTLWVTEYGRRNRVMQFTRTGDFIKEWGPPLYENLELERPMAVSIAPDGQSLYVVDAGNHRINVYDRDGNLKSRFGSAEEWGDELQYPLDLAIAPDQTLYIVFYESCKMARFTRDGGLMSIWGGPGREPGEMFLPFGCTVAPDGSLFIADMNNMRVQVVRDPASRFASRVDDNLQARAGDR